MKLTIYHNPRCRKSREALQYLEENQLEFEIIDYLKNPISENQIGQVLTQLSYSPIELVRKNEAVWKEHFKGKKMSDNDVKEALCAYPKLIERPIIVKGENAIIARPLEKLISFLK